MNQEEFDHCYGQLTPRQQRILELFCNGSNDKQISDDVDIRQDTVRRHISNICRVFFGENQRNSRTLLMQLCGKYLTTNLVNLQVQENKILGEVPRSDNFLGRSRELEEIQDYIFEFQSRLVLLTGMGGVGKTTLVAKLTQTMQNRFEWVIWKSIRVPIRLTSLLDSWLLFFDSHQYPTNNLGEKISLLIHILRHQRCLIILDNLDSIMQEGQSGCYYPEYIEYGQFLRLFAESEHNSCLIVTSREIPNDINCFGDSQAVYKYPLSGFSIGEGKEFLKIAGNIHAADNELKELINYYGGNPLYLKIVTTIIQELYAGNVTKFIDQSLKTGLFNEIRQLFYSHFHRLSFYEKEIIYLLAINREPMTHQELHQSILSIELRQNLDDTILSLKRRSLIETYELAYTIQPVLMKYSTEAFLNQLITELNQEELKLFTTHALIKSSAKDYIRDTQIKLFIQPILERFAQHRTTSEIREFFQKLITKIQNLNLKGYAGGNILNLLCHFVTDLNSYDFSNLVIREADLRGVKLQNTNFQNSHFESCLFSHPLGGILWVVFNPTGNLLAAGDISGNIHIWEVVPENSQNHPLISYHTFAGHDGWVWTIRFSPDGRYLASAGDEYQIRVWDLQTKQLVLLLQGHHDLIRSVHFSSDGILASASDDKTIKLWQIQTGECLCTLTGHDARVRSVSFNPCDSQIIATASDDKTIKIWNIHTQQVIRTFTGHCDNIRTICFSSNGKLIASAGNDKTVRLWDIKTGESRILPGHTHWVRSVDFSPDGKLLVSASEDQTVRLWDVNTGTCLKIFREHTSWVQSVRFSPDGQTFASGSADRTIKLWDVNQGCLTTVQGYTNYLFGIAFHPHGNILAGGYEDKTIRLWNLKTLDYQTLRGHQDWVRSVTFSQDGEFLASSSGDKTVRLWHLTTNECRIFTGHTSWVRFVRFSPDNRYLVSCCDDKTIKIWCVNSGKCLQTLKEHQGWVRAVAFSPDGKQLVSGSGDSTIKVWDIQDIQNIKCIQTLIEHHNWVWHLSFSPDGKTIASAGGDGTVRLWSLKSNKLWENFQTLEMHNQSVRVVAFSPDGSILASGGVDRKLILWDTQTWKPLIQTDEQSDWIRSVAFNNQGLIAIASQDNLIEIRDITGKNITTLRLANLYQGMNIINTTGLTHQQIQNLKALGATQR